MAPSRLRPRKGDASVDEKVVRVHRSHHSGTMAGIASLEGGGSFSSIGRPRGTVPEAHQSTKEFRIHLAAERNGRVKRSSDHE